MTWKQFKQYVEDHGVKDNDVIDYIDTAFLTDELTIERIADADRGVCIHD